MGNQRDREKRKVFNDSNREYVEVFKGKEIRIPARGNIIMNRSEAVAFLGNYVYFDKERSSGEKKLHWEPYLASDTTEEEEAAAAMTSAQLTGETGRKVSMQEAEARLASRAVVQG